MSVLSPIDRKYARLLRANDLSRIIPPHEFTADEWQRIMRDHHMPALLDFARSLGTPASLDEVEQRERILAMLPYYQAGVLLSGGGAQSFANKDIYNTEQSATAYLVAPVASILHVKLWGAGAGSGGGGEASGGGGGAGGGGGYAYDEINVIPGESLAVYVGGAGLKGLNAPPAQNSTGGGSGGFTAIKRGGFTLILAPAGAGGGSGAYGAANAGGNGAPGGNANGINGNNGANGGNGGTGGSTVGGGAGGTGTSGVDGAPGMAEAGGIGGENGVLSTAGAGGLNGGARGGRASSTGTNGNGGGGSPGRYGGGGGESSGGGNGGGGGGGSGGGLTSGINSVLTAGSGVTPANNGDVDYASSAGVGGAAPATNVDGNDGNPGRLVIIW